MKNIKRMISFFFVGLLIFGVFTAASANAATSTLTVFSDGFESGNLSSWSGSTKSYGDYAIASTYSAKNGIYGGRFTTNAGGGIENAYVSKIVDLSEVYVGGYFSVYKGLPLIDNYDSFSLIRLYGEGQALAYVGIRRESGVDRWSLFVKDGSTGLFKNAASTLPQTNKWYQVELHWKLGSSTSGVAELFVNGVKIVGVTGIDTSSYGVVKRVDVGIVNAEGVQNSLFVYSDDFKVEKVENTITTTPVESTTVVVDSTIYLTKSFDGGGKTYKHGTKLEDYPLFSLIGTGITLSNVIIDDNNFDGLCGAVLISGTGNSIKYCTLKNCIRYGFTAAGASKFYIGYNTVLKAQYGISGGSGGSTTVWSTDGVIEHNNIKGMILTGIKCKAFKNVIIRYNYIDTTPQYYHHIQGINFSDDAPNIGVICENNEIIRVSGGLYPQLGSMGLTQDPDPTHLNPEIVQTGNIFRNNKVTNCKWGATLEGNNFTVINNTFTNVIYPVLNYGKNNIISPNTIL